MIASDIQSQVVAKPRLAAIAGVEKVGSRPKNVAKRAIKRVILRRILSQNGNFCAHPWVEQIMVAPAAAGSELGLGVEGGLCVGADA